MRKMNPKIWKEIYIWQYEAYPFFTSVYLGGASPAKNKYFCEWQNGLHFFKDGFLTLYTPNQQFKSIGEIIIKELAEAKEDYLKELDEICDEVKNALEQCLKARHLPETNLNEWWPATENALSHTASFIFNFDFSFDNFLNNLNRKDPTLFNIINQNIIEEKPSFITQANNRLFELMEEYPNNFHTVYKRFMMDFSWIQNSYKGKFQISENWLHEHAKAEIGQKQTSRNDFSQVPREYQLSIKVAKRMLTYKDDKKKLLLLAVDLMNDWLKQECQTNNWQFDEMRWLSLREILSVLSKKGANYTQKARGYSAKQIRCGIMTPEGFDDVEEKLFYDIDKMNNSDKPKNIPGFPASRGSYQGLVKIVLDVTAEGEKMLNGDVLVTSMTRPEFLPIMMKAGAIITDEGGISCHAAILAREMGIPCIIGTKIATKVLKDGDLVEVDADTGVVRRLT